MTITNYAKNCSIKFYNGGWFEERAFMFLMRKIFPAIESPTKSDRNVKIFLSFNWQLKEHYIWNGKKIKYNSLPADMNDDLILFFTGEPWDIEYDPNETSPKKYIIFTPYRDNYGEDKHIFFFPWISIQFIRYHLLNYIYKYQHNKDYSKKKFFIAYCNKNQTKERTDFMNKLVENNTNINIDKEIHSLGPHYIAKTVSKRIPQKYSSPNIHLVNALNAYKFNVVFENCEKNGYITEKLLQAFIANTIPIYWGDHVLAKKIFNPDAMICVRDFQDVETCAKFICNMSEDDIQRMLNEPMFRDNIIPEFFDIENFESGFYREISNRIQSLYI